VNAYRTLPALFFEMGLAILEGSSSRALPCLEGYHTPVTVTFYFISIFYAVLWIRIRFALEPDPDPGN
jgi:hypothetical protein